MSGFDEPQIDFKTKFRFGLACPGLARLKQNFSFDVNGMFVTT